MGKKLIRYSAANPGEHREERERAGQLSCKQIILQHHFHRSTNPGERTARERAGRGRLSCNREAILQKIPEFYEILS